MLPFTKRPGREESGDSDVVTKDDLVKSPTVPPPPTSKRTIPPTTSNAAAAIRPKFSSINDEEMTTLMPTKSLGNAVPAIRPAAGSPPPSRSPSSRPSPNSSVRSGKFAAADDEEDGRTVVRGAPKIQKKGKGQMGQPTLPTTISPAAVIKATLESARGAVNAKRTGEHLMAPPPADLLEDMADRMVDPRHPADVGAEHTQILQSPPVSSPTPSSGQVSGSTAPLNSLSTQMLQPQGAPAPHSSPSYAGPPQDFQRSWTGPPPPLSHQATHSASHSGPYNAQQSGGYPAMHGGPVSSNSMGGGMPPSSMPAHFMVPQAPYSDGRTDPPGTAVTSRQQKPAGRPAMSWAMALAAFGLFVGIGAVAVMHGNSDGLMETSAAFVDPSRAQAPKGAAGPGAPAVAPVAPLVGAAPANAPPAPVAVAPAGAAPAPAAPEAVAAPMVTTPPVAIPPAPVAVAPVAAAPVATAPPAPVAVAAAPRPAPVARPVGQRPRPQPAAPEEPAATTKEPAAAKGGTAKGVAAKPEMDDETKKALIELQKAQLERSLQ